jgi:lipopolysaccharide assembly protein A
MRYILWLAAPVLFLFFVTLAVKNLDAVIVRYFLGYEWRAPLIFVLLIFFIVGVMLGILATLGHVIRQRRELTVLKRELDAQRAPAGEVSPPDLVES